MPDIRLTDEAHRWVSLDLSVPEREARAAQNQASLDRKITYCVSRPGERVQFQHVEGWTTGRVIGYMHGRGLELGRILRDLAATDECPH